MIKLIPVVILIQSNKNDNNALAPCPSSEAFLGNNSSMSEGSWLKFNSVKNVVKTFKGHWNDRRYHIIYSIHINNNYHLCRCQYFQDGLISDKNHISR